MNFSKGSLQKKKELISFEYIQINHTCSIHVMAIHDSHKSIFNLHLWLYLSSFWVNNVSIAGGNKSAGEWLTIDWLIEARHLFAATSIDLSDCSKFSSMFTFIWFSGQISHDWANSHKNQFLLQKLSSNLAQWCNYFWWYKVFFSSIFDFHHILM